MSSGFGLMIILLSFWVGTSLILCLALLGAAARRVPRMDDPIAAAGGLQPGSVPAVALDQADTAGTPARAKLHTTPALAKTAPPTPLLLPRPEVSVREAPLFLALSPAVSKANHLVKS